MRISLYISPELTARLNDLAWREHRHPRQQAEFLLQQILEQDTPSTTLPPAIPQGGPHAQRR